MERIKKKAAWENCPECNCGSHDCHPNNHRLCGICGNNLQKDINKRKIIFGSYSDRCSKYGWNIDHRTPVSIGGTNKNSNLRAAHITCNESRGNH